jgi:hypothetical protein
MRHFHTDPEYLRLVRPMAERPQDDHAHLRLVVADWLTEFAPEGEAGWVWLHRANSLRNGGSYTVDLHTAYQMLGEGQSDAHYNNVGVRAGMITSLSAHGLTGWRCVLDSGVFSRHPVRRVDVYAAPAWGRGMRGRCNWHHAQHHVPDMVWDRLRGTSGTNSHRKWYASQKAAVADMERALLAAAREHAGLPPLE